MNHQGIIVGAHGRHYDIALIDGSVRTGFPRGKKSELACGDTVELADNGRIEAIGERRSLLFRSDAFRQKLIAANVTQVVVVVATEPAFSDSLISRALVAAELEGLHAVIALNKSDLTSLLPAARHLLSPFEQLGYPHVELSARGDVTDLSLLLRGQCSVLVGQSGMGKSTLVNALVPSANAHTQAISRALGSGQHTTTSTRRYELDENASLIDSPGLQSFGLAQYTPEQLFEGFVEFRPLRGRCRYRDCAHDREPQCAIRDAVAAGSIHPRRLSHFHELLGEHRQ